MADRQIIKLLEQLGPEDFLPMQQNYYVALGKFMGQILNSGALGGLLCTATSPPSFNVNIGAGEIYVTAPLNATDYGYVDMNPSTGNNTFIPADPTPILKQGIYTGGSFAAPAPVTPGYSINYLIQVAFQEVDNVAQSRLFAVGGVQNTNTVRQDLAIVQIKPGVPAPTGTQVTPSPDADFIGAWVVRVTYGQASVLPADIVSYPNAPFFGSSYGGALQDMLTLAEAQAVFLTPAQADARYALRPNIGTNAYFGEGNSASVPFSDSDPHLLALVQTGGNFISGGVFNAPFAGFYCGSYFVNFTLDAGSTGEQIVSWIETNGGTVIGREGESMGAGTYSSSLSVSFNAYLGAGDTLTIYTQKTGTGDCTAAIGFFACTAVAN